jgi:hypothetical protein
MAHKSRSPYMRGATYAEAAHNLIDEVDHLWRRKNPAFFIGEVSNLSGLSRRAFEERVGQLQTYGLLYAGTIQLLGRLKEEATAFLEALQAAGVLLEEECDSALVEQEAAIEQIALKCVISLHVIMNSDMETRQYARKYRRKFIEGCTTLQRITPGVT